MLGGGPSCMNVTAPSFLSYTTAAISLVLCLLTAPGNLLVILAVYINPNKSMRNTFNYFIVNLAVADLIVGIVTEPISIWAHIREGSGLPARLEVLHISYFISCTASLFSLAALSAERYFAIAYPIKYRLMFSSNRAAVASIFIWSISLTLPLLYFHVGLLIYGFVFANTSVIVTFGFLLFVYLRIFLSFRAQMREIRAMEESSESIIRRKAIQKEGKVIKTLLIMLVIFICCFAPSCVMIYVMNMCIKCSCLSIHWIRDVQYWMILLASAINPYLYAWRHPSFRNAFLQILRCQFDNRRVHVLGVSQSRSHHDSMGQASTAGNQSRVRISVTEQ